MERAPMLFRVTFVLSVAIVMARMVFGKKARRL
jgi:hypothetical protein